MGRATASNDTAVIFSRPAVGFGLARGHCGRDGVLSAANLLDETDGLNGVQTSRLDERPAETTPLLDDTGGVRAELTRREVECLGWAANGKSEWEISQILGISEHTSEKHLLSAKTKLGAANRVHAVAEAIRRGYIT